jgi:virginiamycin B lyase
MRNGFALIAAVAFALTTGDGLVSRTGGIATAQNAGSLQGLGTVTGTVTSAKPFKAAHVFLHSTDKRRPIEYMVYTQAGAFKTVAVMPGNYQLTLKARGLESDPQPLVVRAGTNPAVTVAMHDAADPNHDPSSVDPAAVRTANGAPAGKRPIQYASYDEIYPAGPGRVVLETLCMNCHGENYFPGAPRSAEGWKAGLDFMMGRALADNEKRGFGEGVLAGSASNFRFGLQDRKDVLEYLTKHFGPDTKRRAVRSDKEMPLDEAQLAKAQYIEYYGTVAQTAASASTAAETAAGSRTIMQPAQIDMDGNRWAVDRGVPNRLTKLDPRTGEIKSWDLPDQRAAVHDMVMDRRAILWVPEFGRAVTGTADSIGLGSELSSRLLGFNTKTEKWEYTVDPDPDNAIRASWKGSLMGGTVDSKGNIYTHWMLTGGLVKLDIASGKATTVRIPTPGAIPYGNCVDPFDNVWLTLWNGGKLARFNAKINSWTEFTPPMQPVDFRRGLQSDAQGNIWVGIWASGNRPAKIAKLDPTTGTWTLWDVPYRGSQPYEASIDKDGTIWFPDAAANRPERGSAIGRFNPRDGSFTFYPWPQPDAVSTRLLHAADGSVHYATKGGSTASSAFGVLFPDKDKITTLAPLPLNGLGMMAFQPAPRNSN